MKYIKKIFFPLLIMTSIILIFPLLISTLSYFGLLNSKITSIFKILVSLSSFLIGGFLVGKKSEKKGYIEGIKLSIIFLVITMIINYFILDTPFKFKTLLYYIILTISCMFGSMIGIIKKQSN